MDEKKLDEREERLEERIQRLEVWHLRFGMIWQPGQKRIFVLLMGRLNMCWQWQ